LLLLVVWLLLLWVSVRSGGELALTRLAWTSVIGAGLLLLLLLLRRRSKRHWCV